MANTFQIRKDLEAPVSPDVLWQAIATAEGQAGWSPDPYTQLDGHAIERDAPNRFALVSPVDQHGAFHSFEYLITPTDEGSALTFVHSGDLGDEWAADFDYEELTNYGWDLYMHNLQQYLAHFADLSPVFVTGQAPQHAATHSAWQQLEQALGLTVSVRDLSVGDPIQLTPHELPVINGMVDYLVPDEDFLGVRSEVGLYRFHSMEIMGMPVAFGHYLYGQDLDGIATGLAWQEWLNAVFSNLPMSLFVCVERMRVVLRREAFYSLGGRVLRKVFVIGRPFLFRTPSTIARLHRYLHPGWSAVGPPADFKVAVFGEIEGRF